MSVSTDSSGPVTNGDVTPSTISTEPSRSNKDEEDDCMKELVCIHMRKSICTNLTCNTNLIPSKQYHFYPHQKTK